MMQYKGCLCFLLLLFFFVFFFLLTPSSFTDGADGSSDERTEEELILAPAQSCCLQPHSITLLMDSSWLSAKLIQRIINTRARWLQWFIWRRLFVKHMTLILLSAWGTSQVNIPRTMNKEEHRAAKMSECGTSDQIGTREPLWNVRTTIDLYFTCCATPRGSCHGSISATWFGKEALQKMTERWRSREREEKAARSAGSYLDRVQWEEVGGPCICPLHAGLRWVGYTLHLLHRMFLRETGVVWQKAVLVMLMVGGDQHTDGVKAALQ